MNWLKQNKLLAGIAAVAIVGTLVLLWLAFSAMGAAGKSVTAYKSANGELTRLYGGALFPSPENLDKKREAVANLATETSNLRASLAKSFSVGQAQDPATFGQRVQKRFEELRTQWEAAGMTVPENFLLGLERYRQSVATNPEAVRELDYQLEAVASVVETAVKSGITSIDKFSRSAVSGEDPAVKLPDDTPLRRYGVEIQCAGPESAIRGFVNAIAASPTHFFALRAVRLQNEVQVGPKKEDVRKEVKADAPAAAGGAADLFAGLAAAAPAAPAAPMTDAERLMLGAAGAAGAGGGGATAPAPEFVFAKPGTKDAYQFLGAEKVKATIRFDLVIFQAAPAKPEAKEEE